jgi:nitrogen regulatory protein PII 2
MLRELTAIVRSNKWKATAEALRNAGFPAMTRQRVYGRGRQKGLRYGTEPGAGGIPVLPKWMLTLVVEDEQVDAALAALVAANRSGEIGDGKVFVGKLSGALRLSDLVMNSDAVDVTLPQKMEIEQ